MTDLVAMIQTTWPNIRVALYRLANGRFQFVEEGLGNGPARDVSWQAAASELFDDIATAKKAMLHYYCECTEEEYRVAPESVTILEAPDFKDPHHPVLIPIGGEMPDSG